MKYMENEAIECARECSIAVIEQALNEKVVLNALNKLQYDETSPGIITRKANSFNDATDPFWATLKSSIKDELQVNQKNVWSHSHFQGFLEYSIANTLANICDQVCSKANSKYK